ncbi:MAG TPA: sensor histidine kinase [Candidatus Micrarchaeia archaeon]|nr:sensor histidine kinase [Candidatus Micrarchaeia archaeon]
MRLPLAALRRRRSLFQTVIVANSLIIVAGALLGTWVTLNLARSSRLMILIGLVTAGIAVSLVVNYVVLRAAFAPLRGLVAVMAAVRRGRLDARATQTGQSPDVRRIAATLNLMLDRLQVERRQRAERVLEAQERERERIARELHDETSQALTRQIIGLDLLRQRTDLPGDARSQIGGLREGAERTLAEVHRLARDLRPTVLDDLGLVPALRSIASDAGRVRSAPRIVVEAHAGAARFSAAVETACYRIVQEALTNAARHSGAETVTVRLEHDAAARRVTVEVVDDGRGGVDPVRAPGGGLGLFGMRERAELLGGSFTIVSQPGVGTRLLATIPLDADEPTGTGPVGTPTGGRRRARITPAGLARP